MISPLLDVRRSSSAYAETFQGAKLYTELLPENAINMSPSVYIIR